MEIVFKKGRIHSSLMVAEIERHLGIIDHDTEKFISSLIPGGIQCFKSSSTLSLTRFPLPHQMVEGKSSLKKKESSLSIHSQVSTNLSPEGHTQGLADFRAVVENVTEIPGSRPTTL
jgi:hypothetical protein